MGTVEHLFKPSTNDIRHTVLKDYERTEDGQWISLTRAVHPDGSVSYAVLICTDEENVEPFDIIREYQGTDDGRAAAEYAAEIADRTLGASCMLMPDPLGGEGAA
jgi:hypothetical protein